MVVPPVGGRILMECRLRTAESFRGGVEPAWTSDKVPPRKSAGVPICMLESGELLFGDGPGAVAVVFDFIYGKHTGRLVLDNGASRGCLKRAALNDKGAASPARYVSQRKNHP